MKKRARAAAAGRVLRGAAARRSKRPPSPRRAASARLAARYRALVEQIPAITYIAALDEASTTLFVSPQIRLLGLTQEECRADPDFWRRHLHPDDRERVLQQLKRNCTGGRPFSTEYRMVAKDGGVVWIRDNAVVVGDRAGRPLFLQGVMFDITKDKKTEAELSDLQKRIEEELNEHRERLEETVLRRTIRLEEANRQLLEEIADRKRAEREIEAAGRFLSSVFASIQDGISVLDRSLRIVRVNPAIERWYAHAMPLVGRKCYAAYHGRSRRCAVCPTARTLANGKVAYEIVPRRGRGGIVTGWLGLYSFPLIDERTGGMTGVIEYVRDITDERFAAESLRESEGKYRALMEDAGDAILIADTDGNLIEANRKAEEMLGYSRGELAGMHLTRLQPPAARARAKTEFERIMRRGEGVAVDIPVARKDGAVIPVDISGSVVAYGGRKVLHASLRDISDRKQVEAMKDSLVRNVSHELKAPIAMMEMALAAGGRALAAGDAAAATDAWRIAERNLKTLGRDVRTILQSFALSARRPALRKARLSLRAAARGIIADLRPAIDERRLAVRVRIAPGADSICADRGLIHTLLFNILDNAVKFTRRGRIALSARAGPEWLVLTVRDTGRGIAAEHTGALFERFYKEDPGTRGTGLGLPICREIAALYGGEVAVASRGPGKGTTVTVRLPARLLGRKRR
ncbi:MAG: PAS domain S-box protein [bacterium]|nr:PAS domain S-box protein [bacterium]